MKEDTTTYRSPSTSEGCSFYLYHCKSHGDEAFYLYHCKSHGDEALERLLHKTIPHFRSSTDAGTLGGRKIDSTVLALLATVGAATTARYSIQPEESDVKALLKPLLEPSKVEAYITERGENTVIQGAEQCVLWATASQQQRAKLCVVYIHGWSAYRQKCSPIPERLAESLNAILYCLDYQDMEGDILEVF